MRLKVKSMPTANEVVEFYSPERVSGDHHQAFRVGYDSLVLHLLLTIVELDVYIV